MVQIIDLCVLHTEKFLLSDLGEGEEGGGVKIRQNLYGVLFSSQRPCRLVENL